MAKNRDSDVNKYRRLTNDLSRTKTKVTNSLLIRRILLIIERSKPTTEDGKLCTSIPANTIKAKLSTDKHYSLPPEADYLQNKTSNNQRLANTGEDCFCSFED